MLADWREFIHLELLRGVVHPFPTTALLGVVQRCRHANLTALVHEVRSKLPPLFPLYTGGYLVYSSIGWMTPAPFWSLVDQSISLYDTNVIQGYVCVLVLAIGPSLPKWCVLTVGVFADRPHHTIALGLR